MKRLLGLAAVLMLGLSMIAPVSAQDATPVPVAPFVTAPGLGLSEFDVVITDDGIGLPAEIPAGRYLVNVTNNSSEFATASFLLPPADWTFEQVQEKMALAGSEEGTPADFAWLFDADIAGGASAEPGGLGQAVIDLTPGRWVIWGDDPSLPITTEVLVTGAMPATLTSPATAVTVTAISTGTGYDFAVEGEFVAGQQLVKFYNKTDQPHFLGTLLTPVAIDDEMFMQIAMADPEAGTPGPEGIDPEQISDGPSTTTISAGAFYWGVMDLPAGFMTLVCYVPDLNNPEGLPHAALGMTEHVVVAEAAAE